MHIRIKTALPLSGSPCAGGVRGVSSPHRTSPVLHGLLSLFSLTLGGCGPEGPSTVQSQLRDSAGVTIVASSALPERGEGGWALDQSPSFTIGTFQGDTLYQLYRVSGGTRLPDGRIVLSENGNLQLRIYAPDGTFLKSWGREGEGPGEFQSIRVMGVLGRDTLVVLDGRLRRISLIHPDDGFLAQSTVDEEVGLTFVSNGMFGDGSMVFGGGMSFSPGGDMPTDGLQRPDTPYRSAGLDGSLTADFGTIPGSEYFMQNRGGGGEFMITASIIPFGKRPVAFARGDRFYLGSADSYEIRGFDSTGRLDRIIRVSHPLTPVTSEDVERLVQEVVADLDDPSQAAGVRSSYRDMPIPDLMPAYRSFLLDSEGCLWVEEYPLPGEGLKTWAIFDAEGVPQTRLSLPSDNRILEVGEDYLMAIFEDQLGIEYLMIYPLTRGN